MKSDYGDFKPLWSDLRFSFFNLKINPKIQFINVEDRLFKFFSSMSFLDK